jgi:DnaJ-class molecular chaperone
MLNYYKILGLKESSSDEQIKNSYKKLALRWHPDKNKTKNAETKFQQIVEAYNILGDPIKRKKYDTEIINKSIIDNKKETKKEEFPINDFNKQFQNFNGIANNGTTVTKTTINGLPGGTTTINGMPDLNALFSQIFGPNNSVFSGIGTQVQQAINSATQSSFTTSSQPTNNQSSSFNGRPPPPTVHEIFCTLEELYNGINKTLLVRDENNEVELDVEIQPGTKDDTKIRFFKKGPSKEDVIFIIKTKDHQLFKRDLSDLHITFDLTLDEANNGCQRTIKLLNDTNYTIKINKLKKSNDIQKISGYGMPIRGSKKKGDLIIHFNILLN